jgi:hypothetical protein
VSKNATRKSKKMFKSYDRLCRFEIWFRCVGAVDDNGVTKLREMITHRGV